MKNLKPIRRIAATFMLGVIAATLIAPAAEAGHGYGRARYKPGPSCGSYVRYSAPYCPPPQVSYVRYHSDAAPLFAGLVGGLILGSVLSNAHPVVHSSYSYWDPYCDESFSSLDLYRSHMRGCGHPHVVRVIDISSGEPVRDLCWRDNAWRVYDGGGYRSDDGWRDRDDQGDDN